MGSGKTGFVITDSALYLHDDDASYEVRFDRIESWAQTEEIVRQDKGDSIVVKSLEISGGDQIVKIPHTVGMLDWARAGDFLDAVVALRQEGMTKDVDGFMAIEALPDGAKLAYIEAIMWLVHHDDGTIDSREFGELRLLMTQLGFSGELRRRTLTMLDDAHNLVLDQVLDKMKRQVPAGAERLISLSLIKDMVRIFNSANGDGAIESPQIAQARELLDVDEEQLQLIHDAAKFERDVFSGSVSSDDLQKSAEGLAAKAAAVGVPIAAVYMSGSVVGLSAAGMTSGLAALGLGGVLGLSSMATGVGVVVLLGIGVYSGIRRVVGGNKEKADAQFRDLMLQEVLRNHQKAIAALGEDLADLAQRIVELSRDVLENKLKIEKLGKEVMLFAEALAQVKLRGKKYEEEAGSSGDRTQDSEVGGAA